MFISSPKALASVVTRKLASKHIIPFTYGDRVYFGQMQPYWFNHGNVSIYSRRRLPIREFRQEQCWSDVLLNKINNDTMEDILDRYYEPMRAREAELESNCNQMIDSITDDLNHSYGEHFSFDPGIK